MFRPVTALVLPALLALSCATPRNPDPFQATPGEDWRTESPEDLMIRVENNHYDPVVVSAVWGTSTHFLGEIQPGATEVYWIPGHILQSEGNPRFRANPRGPALEQVTDPIRCKDARWIEWRLKRNMMPSRPVILGR